MKIPVSIGAFELGYKDVYRLRENDFSFDNYICIFKIMAIPKRNNTLFKTYCYPADGRKVALVDRELRFFSRENRESPAVFLKFIQIAPTPGVCVCFHRMMFSKF